MLSTCQVVSKLLFQSYRLCSSMKTAQCWLRRIEYPTFSWKISFLFRVYLHFTSNKAILCRKGAPFRRGRRNPKRREQRRPQGPLIEEKEERFEIAELRKTKASQNGFHVRTTGGPREQIQDDQVPQRVRTTEPGPQP